MAKLLLNINKITFPNKRFLGMSPVDWCLSSTGPKVRTIETVRVEVVSNTVTAPLLTPTRVWDVAAEIKF